MDQVPWFLVRYITYMRKKNTSSICIINNLFSIKLYKPVTDQVPWFLVRCITHDTNITSSICILYYLFSIKSYKKLLIDQDKTWDNKQCNNVTDNTILWKLVTDQEPWFVVRYITHMRKELLQVSVFLIIYSV